jgi:class 3 adenylate cyclase/Tfp pilus assembly protein PilF
MPAGASDQLPERRISELERIPKAVLFADVVDSVRLIESDEHNAIQRWLDFVKHLETEILPAHHGRLVKTLGDGLFMAFDDVTKAVRTAFAILRRIERNNADLPPQSQVHMRMGLDIGEVLLTENSDLMGHRVNVAARLMTLAQPAEIVATADVRDALVSELDAEFEDMGDCYLRNVAKPVRAFRVHPHGAQSRFKPLLTEADLLPTIAVVPFSPRHRNRDNFALGEVLAEDIIFALSRSSDLNVISRLSTTGFRLRKSSASDIGAALDADFVLSGSYSGDEHRVILDVELAEVRTGHVIWSSRISEDVPAILQGQSSIDSILSEIQRAILKREVSRALANPMPTLESYSLLISHNPTPHTSMAKWHVLRVQQGWTDSPEREAALAQQCTQRALATDPTNVPALVNEGFVLTNLLHRLDEAEERYDTALEHSPNDAAGRLLRGTLYAFRGEGEIAMRDTERALHLAPLDPHRFFYHALAASACIAAENYPRALELANRSLRSNRAHTSTLRVKAVAEMRLGKAEDARKTAQELLRRQPQLTVSKWLRGAPSADFEVGREFAKTLLEAGIPE